jgi:DNA-binding IclR family transcriptional regulator
MSISKEMKNILSHIAEMSDGNTSNGVYDTALVTQSGLPKEEVYKYLGQLESLDLIKIGVKGSGVDFRIINITQNGLQNSSWSEVHDMR